mgnify:CR=1 FL=1
MKTLLPRRNPAPALIRAAREAGNMTMAEAAAVMNVSESTWEEWEAGTSMMTTAQLDAFRIQAGGRALTYGKRRPPFHSVEPGMPA